MYEIHNDAVIYINKILDIYDKLDDTNRKYIEVELIRIVYQRYKNNPLMLEHFDSIVDYDILQFVKMGL